MIKLKYGNTNTFYISGSSGSLLVDTGYAGTLQAFYKALKAAGLKVSDISYVLCTHYHPDHMGLVPELMQQGVKLLLVDVQKPYVHFSDCIFSRDRLPFTPINEAQAQVITCGQSRAFLQQLGILGELIHTPSHSPDSVSLILDDGNCIVGDLEPFEYIEAYGSNEALQRDWDQLLAFEPKSVWYAHRPEKVIQLPQK